MKAFRRFAREERAARLVELPIPEPNKKEVLLKVSHCGVCGSDLHAWLNHKGYESVLPEVTFGHELSGTVEKVGLGAEGWQVGDQAVMIALQTPYDLNDRYCRANLPQLSSRRRVQGLHLDGGMAEYVCVDTEFLIRIPDGLPLSLAALTEPLSVAEHCIESRTHIQNGSDVVVSGPGIIGLLCAISARNRGANVLLSGTERDEPVRLHAARKIGFETLTVGPEKVSLDEQVLHHFPHGADALVEASGAPAALSDSWKSVRPDGTVTAVALYSRSIDIDLTQFLRKQIDLRTSYASSKDDYLRSFDLLLSEKIDSSILTKEYPLKDAEQGFIDSEQLEVTKVLLDCSVVD
jgi:L-iditol 2-dehydrogenase